jgi:glycosyltransferase involved in cell wall biosynthesis
VSYLKYLIWGLDEVNRKIEYTIFAPGFAKWWGCDPRALAQSFRRMGHTMLEIDAEDYVPWRWCGFLPRVLRRLFIKTLVDDYNRAVVQQAHSSFFDFILVFKGMYLKAETLRVLRTFGKPVYNFYPDCTFVDYGHYIPMALRYYDCVFTTKSFHGTKEVQDFNIKDMVHVRHGFDPEVHRPLSLSPNLLERYGCDVSFVGCWSPNKERTISYIIKNNKQLKVRVYGIGWNYASSEFKKMLGTNLKPGVYGDELAVAYCASKINLGLLSRSISTPSIQDLTTVRTFQIPACKAFMIHEDTEEVRSYFEADKEIILFNKPDDLLQKINETLSNENMRLRIAENAYNRCLSEPYDYAAAANAVIEYFETKRNSMAHKG